LNIGLILEQRGGPTTPKKRKAGKALKKASGNPLVAFYDWLDGYFGKLEPRWLPVALMYLGLSMVTAYSNYKAGGLPSAAWHENMMDLKSVAPNAYRVLPAFAAEATHRLLGVSAPFAYGINGCIFIFMAACVFHVFLKKWFSTEVTLVGTLFMFAALPLTYGLIAQPSDTFSLFIWALGLLLIRDKKDVWLIPVILVGTLNRETTLFLVLAYFLFRWDEAPKGRLIGYSAAYFVSWLAVYEGLRLWIGPRDYGTDYWQYGHNIDQWYYSLAFPALLFGVFWVMALMDWAKKPKFLTRSALIIPPFIFIHFFIANLMEARLFDVLFLIIVPLALFSLFKGTYLKAESKG